MTEKKFFELIGTDVRKSLDLKEKSTEQAEIFSLVKDYSHDPKAEEIHDGRWGVLRGFIFIPSDQVADKLTSGVYRVGFAMGLGYYLRKQEVLSDHLLELPDDASTEILHHIEDFWKLKEEYTRYGFLHKRGILLHGPQGGGKTSTIIQTIKKLTNKQGIILLGDYPGDDIAGIQMLRELEPNRPLVVVYEDVDGTVQRYGDRALTEILDGEANVNNVMFLATTNYPERLPSRLMNRPSRFDIIKYIGMPSAEARKMYLAEKVKDMAPSEIEVWVSKTDGLSIPHIKELIILVKVLKKGLDESIMQLKGMKKIPNSQDYTQEIR